MSTTESSIAKLMEKMGPALPADDSLPPALQEAKATLSACNEEATLRFLVAGSFLRLQFCHGSLHTSQGKFSDALDQYNNVGQRGMSILYKPVTSFFEALFQHNPHGVYGTCGTYTRSWSSGEEATYMEFGFPLRTLTKKEVTGLFNAALKPLNLPAAEMPDGAKIFDVQALWPREYRLLIHTSVSAANIALCSEAFYNAVEKFHLENKAHEKFVTVASSLPQKPRKAVPEVSFMPSNPAPVATGSNSSSSSSSSSVGGSAFSTRSRG